MMLFFSVVIVFVVLCVVGSIVLVKIVDGKFFLVFDFKFCNLVFGLMEVCCMLLECLNFLKEFDF